MASKKKTSEEATPAKGTESLKKMSIKTLRGKKISVKELPDDGSVLPLMRVAGVVTGTKTGMSDNGEWTALVGSFIAVNKENGRTFRSAKLFLPSELTEIYAGRHGEGQGPFDIKADVGVRYDEDSSVSYVYICEDLLGGGGASDEDMLAKLND